MLCVETFSPFSSSSSSSSSSTTATTAKTARCNTSDNKRTKSGVPLSSLYPTPIFSPSITPVSTSESQIATCETATQSNDSIDFSDFSVASQRTEFRQKVLKSWKSRKCSRYRVESNLVIAKLPTQEELNIVDAITEMVVAKSNNFLLERFGSDTSTTSSSSSSSASSTSSSPSSHYESFSRGAFLNKYKQDILTEFPESHIKMINTSNSVLQRFSNACDQYGCFPEIGFHGSPRSNWASILAKGVLDPSQHDFIPSNIHGVYTTKLGNGNYSRYYTDSSDVFVVGVIVPPTKKQVNSSNNADSDSSSNDCVVKKRKKSKMVGQHRQHKKYSPSFVQTSTKRYEKKKVEEYHGVRVIHDEALVAPLFVAENAYPSKSNNSPVANSKGVVVSPNPLLRKNTNRNGASKWVGRHQQLIEATTGNEDDNEIVWLPPQPDSYINYKKVKRRHERKKQDKVRRLDRASKFAQLQVDA